MSQLPTREHERAKKGTESSSVCTSGWGEGAALTGRIQPLSRRVWKETVIQSRGAQQRALLNGQEMSVPWAGQVQGDQRPK